MGEVGRTDEALAELRDIIAKNDASDSQLFATAYLAQGAAFRQADRALDAVMAYLHVDLLFFNQRDAHAEAARRRELLGRREHGGGHPPHGVVRQLPGAADRDRK